MLELTSHTTELRRLTRTDRDPRVRHRADALLVLAHTRTAEEAAHDIGCCTKRLRVWRRRSLAEGRIGLADHRRAGRLPLLDGEAQQAPRGVERQCVTEILRRSVRCWAALIQRIAPVRTGHGKYGMEIIWTPLSEGLRAAVDPMRLDNDCRAA